VPDAGPALRASLTERLRKARGDVPEPLVDAVLDAVDVPGGTLRRVRPRSFDAVRAADAALGRHRATPYWASAWPAGTALTRAVAAAGGFDGAQTLEVGCGLALPSVAAALAGATVLATDRSPEAVVYAAHNLAINRAPHAEAAVADWTRADALGDEWDVLLGADVLYTFQQAEQLHALVDRVVAPGGEVWLADPGRAGCKQFLAETRGQWQVTSEPSPDGATTIHRMRRKPSRGRHNRH
jgi:predicted nicotinamide N-methyase